LVENLRDFGWRVDDLVAEQARDEPLKFRPVDRKDAREVGDPDLSARE
jgi:hypothetical protein